MSPTSIQKDKRLEEVLEDERAQAAVLRNNDRGHDAILIERVCDRVTEAAQEYLSFLGEQEAMLRTGRTVEYLRARFDAWESRGLARRVGRTRYYRALILEPRGNQAKARADAIRTAREGSAT